MNPKDQRRMERFVLELPSVVSVSQNGGKPGILELQTSNICAGGAFFKTDKRLAEGTRVNIELMLSMNESQASEGKRTIVRVSGVISRIEGQGMAIQFESYQMVSSCAFANADDVVVHIIGPNYLQNMFMGWFLETHTNLKCAYDSELRLPAVMNSDGKRHLILADSMGLEYSRVRDRLKIQDGLNVPRCLTAFFNGASGRNGEKELIQQGVRGVFYSDDSPEKFSEGILAILNGKLRYSDEVLSECLLEGRGFGKMPDKNPQAMVLTSREREILCRLSCGASNKIIANDLCISLHTVKTHVYNIYKKINVSDRFQAALWAATYLSSHTKSMRRLNRFSCCFLRVWKGKNTKKNQSRGLLTGVV